MIKLLKKFIVVLMVVSVFTADMSFFCLISYADDKVAYVKATAVNVRAGAGTTYSVLGQVTAGDKVNIKSSTTDSSNKIWYQIVYNNKKAFIRSDFVYTPKEYIYDESFEIELTKQNFPEDYKEYLRLLHTEYPNWKFESYNTNFDFEYVVEMENEGTRSLVTTGAISSYKSTEDGKFDWTTSSWPTFDGKAWVCASKDAIRYYLDPRNFLIDPFIFQFEKQTFDNSLHTLEGVKEMVKGTFLDANIQTTGSIDKLINTNMNYITPANDPSQNYNYEIPQAPIATEIDGPVVQNNAFGPTSNGVPNSNSSNSVGEVNEISNVDEFGNVIPILENNEEDLMINFASTIYIPSGARQDLVTPFNPNIVANTEAYEESSFYFTYLPAGMHSYAEIIFDACRQVGINPYVVVATILQEQGKEGKSDLISGQKQNYLNLYNYGNIGAYAADGHTAIENGLIYASNEGSYNRPWNTKEKGIYGVIDYYANSFIKRGQDTFYLKKWNVQGNNAFKHQYMTNILAAASEGQILASAYSDVIKRQKHIMKIPLYKNMPINRCEKPVKDGNPNNKLKDLTVSGYVLTPTFDKNIQNYTLIVPEGTRTIKVNAVKYHSKASTSGTGNIQLNTAITTVVVRVVAENGDIREYNIMVYTPGALNNIDMTNQIQQQGEPVIIPNVISQNNNVPANVYVPSPPVVNNVQSGNIIYGVLTQ